MTTLVFASHTFGASILVAAFTTTFGREPGAKGEKRFIKAALKKKKMFSNSVTASAQVAGSPLGSACERYVNLQLFGPVAWIK